MEISLNDFKKWCPLSEEELEKVPEKPGVYALRVLDYKINRLLGTDSSGFLYFGETGSKGGERGTLYFRLWKAYQKATKGGVGHTFGYYYYYLAHDLKKDIFELSQVEFSYIVCSSEETKALESKYLWKYFDQFGEAPPFNFEMSNS